VPGVGGMTGMLLPGVFATQALNPANKSGNGLFFGAIHLFLVQLITLVAVSIFAFGGSRLLHKFTDLITPLRVRREEEELGLYQHQHEEKIAA